MPPTDADRAHFAAIAAAERANEAEDLRRLEEMTPGERNEECIRLSDEWLRIVGPPPMEPYLTPLRERWEALHCLPQPSEAAVEHASATGSEAFRRAKSTPIGCQDAIHEHSTEEFAPPK